MKRVLILDCETSGLDREKDRVLEVGCILWDVEHRSIVEVHSRLLPAQENPAEPVNGIPTALLRTMQDVGTWEGLASIANEADAICAHQADFDRAFCENLIAEHDTGAAKVWICTREDMTWPKTGTGESLIATALAHGVAVTSAHRAIHDCLLLARLFEAVPDIGERLDAAYAHAKLPKVRLVSLAPFEEKDIVKAHGFKWDQPRKEWWRVMATEDAKGLPFRTREVPW